jgi:glutathione S-transferase
MTITLCGFALSNYYNKVKLVLLEKGIAFEKQFVWTGGARPEAVLAASPLGNIPSLRTP